jgi:MoaA/NifB/PqqE/SkfB family radical SAM enzyme
MAALVQAFAPAGAAARATARARRTRALATVLLSHCPTPRFEGSRLTWRRRLNFQLVRAERLTSRATVRGYPAILTIDPRNTCNLRCPHCVTGARKPGRPAASFSPAMLERLLDELGRYLLLVEFGNWGEPLLAPQLPDLVAAAARRGIGTIVASNLAVPLDDRRAEALVASGLAVLGAAVDGMRQESYEAYRRGGDLAVVHANLERLIRAKRRLGSATPRLVWSFHVFAHNEHEIEAARAEAARLGVDFACSKGFVVGTDWDPTGRYPFTFEARPGRRVEPCHFLWERAVVHPDGSVAPCLGAFSTDDDFGHLDGRSFRAVWNGARFQAARHLYRRRPPAEHSARLICANCPQTTLWHDYRDHRGAGGSQAAFRPALTAHMGWNYFFARIPSAPPARTTAED